MHIQTLSLLYSYYYSSTPLQNVPIIRFFHLIMCISFLLRLDVSLSLSPLLILTAELPDFDYLQSDAPASIHTLTKHSHSALTRKGMAWWVREKNTIENWEREGFHQTGMRQTTGGSAKRFALIPHALPPALLWFVCACSFRLTNRGLHSEWHSMPCIDLQMWEGDPNTFSSFVWRNNKGLSVVICLLSCNVWLLFCAGARNGDGVAIINRTGRGGEGTVMHLAKRGRRGEEQEEKKMEKAERSVCWCSNYDLLFSVAYMIWLESYCTQSERKWQILYAGSSTLNFKLAKTWLIFN